MKFPLLRLERMASTEVNLKLTIQLGCTTNSRKAFNSPTTALN